MQGETLITPPDEQMQLPKWSIDIVRGGEDGKQHITLMPLSWQSDGTPRLKIPGGIPVVSAEQAPRSNKISLLKLTGQISLL